MIVRAIAAVLPVLLLAVSSIDAQERRATLAGVPFQLTLELSGRKYQGLHGDFRVTAGALNWRPRPPQPPR